jgi:hypothetical protein
MCQVTIFSLINGIVKNNNPVFILSCWDYRNLDQEVDSLVSRSVLTQSIL